MLGKLLGRAAGMPLRAMNIPGKILEEAVSPDTAEFWGISAVNDTVERAAEVVEDGIEGAIDKDD